MQYSIQQLLNSHKNTLQQQLAIDTSSARIEIQMLLQRALEVDRAYLLTHPQQILSPQQQQQFDHHYQRRLAGEPLAYILGEREFFGLNFIVSPATLIPRPDTELLVELALERIPTTGQPRILDLGTGSGAIALSIAHHRPQAQVIALDMSADALAIAAANMQALQLTNVTLLQSHWFAQLGAQCFELIVSNPPYIADTDPHLQQGDLRYEPDTALSAGNDGLDDIRGIIHQAPRHLQPGGWLLLEHGYDQAAAVRQLLQPHYPSPLSFCDLAGIERVSGAQSAAN